MLDLYAPAFRVHGRNGWPVDAANVHRARATERAASRVRTCTDLATTPPYSTADPNYIWSFQHNTRNELTGANRMNAGQPDPNTWSYQYDAIGNRMSAAHTRDPNLTYWSSNLNQYYAVNSSDPNGSTGRQDLVYDADGNLITTAIAADMTCDNKVDWRDIDALVAALNDNVSGYNNWLASHYPGRVCNWLNGDLNGDGHVNWQDIDPFTAKLNTTAVVLWPKYTWDAENRLIAVEPAAPKAGDKRTTFGYDYQGRRVRKQAFTRVQPDPNDPNTAAWVADPNEERRYVWDGLAAAGRAEWGWGGRPAPPTSPFASTPGASIWRVSTAP